MPAVKSDAPAPSDEELAEEAGWEDMHTPGCFGLHFTYVGGAKKFARPTRIECAEPAPPPPPPPPPPHVPLPSVPPPPVFPPPPSPPPPAPPDPSPPPPNFVADPNDVFTLDMADLSAAREQPTACLSCGGWKAGDAAGRAGARGRLPPLPPPLDSASPPPPHPSPPPPALSPSPPPPLDQATSAQAQTDLYASGQAQSSSPSSTTQPGIAGFLGGGMAAVFVPMVGVLVVGGIGLALSSKFCRGYAPAATHGDDEAPQSRRRRRAADKLGRRGRGDDDEFDAANHLGRSGRGDEDEYEDEEDGLTAMARRNGLD